MSHKNSLRERLRLPTSPEARANRHNHLVPVILALGTTAVVLAVTVGPKAIEVTGQASAALNNSIDALGEKVHGPAFSDELIVTQASEGDTVWDDIVPLVKDPRDHATEGEIQSYILNLYQNKETFEDGTLSQGELVYYPARVE